MKDLLTVHWTKIDHQRFANIGRKSKYELSTYVADGAREHDTLILYRENGVPRLLVDAHTENGRDEISYEYFENRGRVSSQGEGVQH